VTPLVKGSVPPKADADEAAAAGNGENAAIEEAASPPGAASDAESEAEPMELGDFVISITDKRGLRMLHRLGRCYRWPGIHYKDYELLGKTRPGPYTYDKVCGTCWPRKEGSDSVALELQSGSEGSGSSSTSSSKGSATE